jgi:hypothetical protein
VVVSVAVGAFGSEVGGLFGAVASVCVVSDRSTVVLDGGGCWAGALVVAGGTACWQPARNKPPVMSIVDAIERRMKGVTIIDILSRPTLNSRRNRILTGKRFTNVAVQTINRLL